MKKVYCLCVIVATVIGLSMLSFRKTDTFQQQITTYVDQHLTLLKAETDSMLAANSKGDMQQLQAAFFRARSYYKKIESIVEYFYTESAVKINGPNLLEAEPSMPGEFIAPTGFQVLEESVFSEDLEKHTIRNEIENLKFYVQRVQHYQSDVAYSSSNILDALKMNLFRMMTKGITGFDSPVILNSIPEAKETLHGTRAILSIVSKEDKTLTDLITKATLYLETVPDFDSWDRATFLTQYMNPITTALVYYQRNIQVPFDTLLPRLIHPEALTLFDYSKWNILFFAPSDALPVTNRNIKIGEGLFYDNRISVNLKRNCSSCHDPSKAFTDGQKTNTTLLGDKTILRNSPTLVNAAWQPNQFYDRRVVYLEDQIHDVVTNEQEMGQDFGVVLSRLNKDRQLLQQVKEAIGTTQLTERDVKRFIATYIRSLNDFQSPFDQYMQGNASAMSKDAVNGFNLFMGKAKCGTCHFMPLFNGTVPPNFEKIESEVLGVPIAKNQHQVDTDLGAYNIYKIAYQKYSFKTPTVRKAAKTAPYMHNGIYETIEEVVDFYDHGGGAGIGIELEYQTLPPDSLHLSPQEKKDIKHFLLAL